MITDLVLTNPQGRDVTTSLIVAEIFGKRHDHVLRDIETLSCSRDFNLLNFGEIEYVDSRGRKQKAYEMTKDGFSFLVMGYTGEKAAEFKERFISEFNKREAMLKSDDYILDRAMSIMSTRMKLLESSLMQKDQQLQLQQSVIKESAPKVEYHDKVLTSQSTYTTTQVAKELGMSAVELNKILFAKKVQFNQSGTWVLYAPHQNKGYTKTHTTTYTDHEGKTRTSMLTVWTELGRKFIHSVVSPKLQLANN